MFARALLVSLAAVVFAPIALADGGPDPPVLVGGGGIANANGSVRFVTTQAGAFTTVESIGTSGILNSTAIRGAWGIPLVDHSGTAGGLAPDGRTLVLAPSGYDGVCTPQACTPLRRTTQFLVFDPKSLHRRATVTLRGDFAFDALSPNGERLYLIEHTSRFNTNKYIVRAYSLRQRRLLPGVIADRSQRGWIMQGIPMARATSTGGRDVYTLYANPGGYPFIHALDTVAGRAHCIGIPWTNEQSLGDLDLVQLSSNGQTLSIGRTIDAAGAAALGANTSTQMYFTLDTRSYRVAAITPSRDGFPWWTLSLLALAVAPMVAVSRKRSRRGTIRSADGHVVPGSA